ncbi:MAG: PAS domain S-box protein, partial [Phycisphaerae bacterium]|nr:PAS domain S-box protein [Phycisphaerae bacterium]
EMHAAILQDQWDVVLSDAGAKTLRSSEARALLQNVAPDLPFVVMAEAPDGGFRCSDTAANPHAETNTPAHLAATISQEIEEARARRSPGPTRMDLDEPPIVWQRVIDALGHPFCVFDARDFTVLRANTLPERKPRDNHEAATPFPLPQSFRRIGPIRMAALSKVKRSRKPVVVDCTEHDATGRKRMIEIHAHPVLGENGDVDQIVEYRIDVTDHRDRETALRASEARYRDLFMLANDIILTVDKQGIILDINSRVEPLTGFTREELLGTDVFDLIVPDDRDRLQDILRQLIDGKPQSYEVRWRTKNGALITFEGNSSPRHSASGEFLASRCVLRDISDRKRNDRLWRDREARLRQAQKMEALGTLASGVAHDFSNLVTAIFGYATLAKKTLIDGHPAIDMLGMIERISQQAGEVTKSLLLFGRRAPAEKKPLELGRVVDESLQLLRRVLPASVELVEDRPADSAIWVRADRTQIQQVLLNLATNARDAMPDGGQLRIEVRRDPAQTEDRNDGASAWPDAVLTVEDTGIGMSPEVRSRIFEPFFTTKARGRGTGLGMAVIHGIVSEHGGTIAVDSEPGQGTRVTLRLPCCETDTSDLAEERPQNDLTGNGELVVLAEDNSHIRSIMATTLRSQGFEVIQAADGEQALAAFEAHRDDARLIILDLDLSKVTGLACLREIRRMNAEIPVIVVTQDANFELDEDGTGKELLLPKPFPMATLAALVARTLAQPAHKERQKC